MTLLTTLQLNLVVVGAEKFITVSAAGSSQADIHTIGDGGFPFIFGPEEYEPGVLRDRSVVSAAAGDSSTSLLESRERSITVSATDGSSASVLLGSELFIDIEGGGDSEGAIGSTRIRVIPGITADGTSASNLVVAGTVSLSMTAAGTSSATFTLSPGEYLEIEGAGSSSGSIHPVVSGGFPFIFGEYDAPGLLRDREIDVTAAGSSSTTSGPLEKIRLAKLLVIAAAGGSTAIVGGLTRERVIVVGAHGGSAVDIEIGKRFAPPKRRPVATSTQKQLVTSSVSSGLVTSSRQATVEVASVV